MSTEPAIALVADVNHVVSIAKALDAAAKELSENERRDLLVTASVTERAGEVTVLIEASDRLTLAVSYSSQFDGEGRKLTAAGRLSF